MSAAKGGKAGKSESTDYKLGQWSVWIVDCGLSGHECLCWDDMMEGTLECSNWNWNDMCQGETLIGHHDLTPDI